MSFQILPLDNSGSSSYVFNLGTLSIKIVTRFNYTANCWVADILDSMDVPLLVGVMLIPNIDLLLNHLDLKNSLGGLMLIEYRHGYYQLPDSLGYTTQLVWFPPGTPIVIPVQGVAKIENTENRYSGWDYEYWEAMIWA